MRKHDLGIRRLAERTNGKVAESTIRSYLADKRAPRAENALALALPFRPE